MYMKIAWVVASQSTAQKRKVGAIIVQDDNIISIGFNGTSPGEDNCCEDANGNTKPEVVHAEDNACKKLERSRQSAVGAEVFVTKIPCRRCAERLVSKGIVSVYYDQWSRTNNTEGIDFLVNVGIHTEHVSIKQ